jgi:hypothetical protein
MGSMIEINDTLQISKVQGFPAKLDINRHLKTPFSLADVADKEYAFKNKPAIRVYQQPPVRNFLVENINDKWIYWGKCLVLEVHHDYTKQITSGIFKIIALNSPEEMRKAFTAIDLPRPEFNYFTQI